MIWKLKIDDAGELKEIGEFTDEEKSVITDAEFINEARRKNPRIPADVRTIDWVDGQKDADGNVLEKVAVLVAKAQNKGVKA